MNRDTPVTKIGPEDAVIEMPDANVHLSSDQHGVTLTISGPTLIRTNQTFWNPGRLDATVTIRPALGPTPWLVPTP